MQFGHCSLYEALPRSTCMESWIKMHFDEAAIRACSITVTGLPFLKRGNPNLSEIMKTVLTINGNLPYGHTGIIGSRIMAAQGEFTGQVWLLWSNTRLAKACERMFTNAAIWSKKIMVSAMISETMFHFGEESTLWTSPRCGPRCWSHAGSHDQQS